MGSVLCFPLFHTAGLLRSDTRPVIAVDPKNPNIIIIGAMANENYIEGEKWAVGVPFSNWESVIKYRNTPDGSIAEYAISYDRGRTWKFFDDPFRHYFKMNGIADTFVGIGKDERLFIGVMNFFPQNAPPLMRQLEREPNPSVCRPLICICNFSAWHSWHPE